MSSDPVNQALRRSLQHLRGAGELSDGQLLERFAAGHEESAFEVLIRRHGAMVLRVCQRVLHDAHEAEDAFQATFIVLARKAAQVATMASVVGWLHGVAYRTALNARKQRARRPSPTDCPIDRAGPAGREVPQELRAVLDEELNRLPEKYRAPVVLCYLEGKSTEEAARQFGCPKGTVLSRLARGREQLRHLLARRGVTCASAALPALLAQHSASAAVPVLLLTATVRTAALLAAGQAVPAGLYSGQAAALADAALQGMAWAKARWLAAALVLLALLGTTVAWATVAWSDRATERSPAVERSRPELAMARPGHTQVIRALAFTPNGSTLASGSADQTVRLWDLATQKHLATLSNQNAPILAMAFAPNGKLLAVRDTDRLRLWDQETLTPRAAWAVGRRKAMDRAYVAFSRDSTKLATADWEGEVLAWDVAAGTRSPDFRWPDGKSRNITCLTFSPSNQCVGVNSTLLDQTWWYVADGKVFLHRIDPPSIMLTANATILSLNLRGAVPKGKLEIQLKDRSVPFEVWDVLTTQERLASPRAGDWIAFVAVSPDGRKVVSLDSDNALKHWLVDKAKQELIELPTAGTRLPTRGTGISSLSFSPDGKQLALARIVQGERHDQCQSVLELVDFPVPKK